MQLLLACACTSLALAVPATATNVSGAITTNTTWTLANSPYVVTGTVTVSNNAQLTIEPGVEVRFNALQSLVVGSGTAGVLVAQGTGALPILFTTNSATPAAGQWGGIQLNVTSATTLLDHCTIEYGGSGTPNCNLRVGSATPTIQNCTVRLSDGYGAFVTGATTRPHLVGNAFESNGLYPLHVEFLALPTTFTGNTFSANARQAIELLGGTTQVDVTIPAQPVRYDVTSSINVNTTVVGTVTLTVAPGTTLAFASALELQLGSGAGEVGVLVAQGTAALPIVFTSSNAVPAAGQWGGIEFAVTSAATQLSYCTVEYGGSGTNNADVRVASSTPTFDHCTFRTSDGYGMFITGAGVRPVLTTNAFDSNGGHPLHFEILSVPATITGNAFTNNGKQAIELLGGSLVADTALQSLGVRYEVTSSITVNAAITGTVTLTLAPGVTLAFAAAFELQLGASATQLGVLVAQGTSGQPIVFTSSNAAPAAGQWGGIDMVGTSAATVLSNCVVEYAGSGTNDSAIRIASSRPTIESSTIRFSDGRGINTLGSAPILRGNTIQSCATIGVFLGTGIAGAPGGATFENNTVTSCGARPLHLEFTNYPASLSGNTYTSNGIQAVELGGGSLDTSYTLVNEGLPYDVLSQLVVNLSNSGFVTWTIAPGNVLRFASSVGLEVGDSATERGILVARGTTASPIVFTGATATPGFWDGITFVGTTADSILEHCTIEYGGAQAANSNVAFTHSNPSMRWCRVRQSDGFGISLSGAFQPLVHACEITNNVLGGVTGTSGGDMRLNWWGDASGPSGSGPGSGQSISAGPAFEPWLGAVPTPAFEWSTAAANTPDPFTQNGGSTAFQASASEAANWTLTLRDTSSTVVRTFTGSGAALAQAWSGDDASATSLPNGAYAWELAATSVASSAVAAPARGTVTLNSALLRAAITSPLPDAYISGSVPITGTAAGAGFASYLLQYGVGFGPTTFTTIASSTTQVDNGTLGTWNTAALTAPVYTLRLQVTPTSGTPAVALVPVNLLTCGAVTATPAAISPNQDGVNELARIIAQPTHPIDWTLTIRNAASAVVRTLSGSGAAVDATWDGRDAAALLVPDGVYTCQLTGVLAGGGSGAASTSTSVTLDTLAPVAAIDTPVENAIIESGAPLPFVGSAADLNLASWNLRRGVGASPATFPTLISSGTTDVAGGLLGTQTWGTTVNGVYTYRLSVTDDAGNVTVVDRHITLDRLEITNVGRTLPVFQPQLGETTSFTYTINNPADVTLQVYRVSPQAVVRTIAMPAQPEGANAIVWDGRDDGGVLLPFDVYRPVLSAIDALATTASYPLNPASPPNGPTPITTNYEFSPASFNPYSNENVSIRFDFSELGRMTLQVRQVNNTPIRNLLVSTPTSAGHHDIPWDGRADDGSLWAGAFEVYWGVPQSLPENSVLATGFGAGPIGTRANAWLIHPLFGEISALSYDLAAPAHVTITIRDPNGNSVRLLQDEVLERAGSHAIEWDGRNDTGAYVDIEGSYRVTIATVDAASGATVQRVLSLLLYRS